MRLVLDLPPAGALRPNNADDPLPYYYRPVVGRIFRARIDLGLRLLEAPVGRLLEVGYGSGLLMPTLARAAREVWGIDLAQPAPGLSETLGRLGARPRLLRGSVEALPVVDGFFDAVVAFSIFEHVPGDALRRALAEVARVLAPGGQLLVGCPAVHKAMNAAFAAIGFSGIERHHVSGLPDIVAAGGACFDLEARAALPSLFDRAPLGWAPYTAVRLRRRRGG